MVAKLATMFPLFFGAALLGVMAILPQNLEKEGFTEASGYLTKTVAALDRLTWFLQHHYEEGNLDLFIGTRIAEGQLSTLVNYVSENPNSVVFLTSPLVERIKILRDQLDFVTERGVSLVATIEPEYYKRLGGILKKGAWDIDYSTLRKVNKSMITGSERKETIKENQSDDCINNMLISASRSGEGCVISDSCWSLMTAPHFYGYSLTHQIFLLEIAAKAGCMEELKRHAQQSRTSLTELSDRICANVYGQAEEIAHTQFPVAKHDIFIEQIALCGILGYGSFFKSTWLDEILDWQMPLGCYGEKVTTTTANPYAKFAAFREQEKRKKRLETAHIFRTKRQEKRMNDGCSAHRTAVAAAALAAYIKFLALFVSGSL